MLFNVIYVFCQVSWGLMNRFNCWVRECSCTTWIDIGFFNIFKLLWQILLCIGLDMDFSCFFHASRALAWICNAKTCKNHNVLWKVSTQAAYTRWRAQGNSGVPLKAVGWGPPLWVHPKISEDAVPMGAPNPLMNHNCSYWNGNFRFFGICNKNYASVSDPCCWLYY